MSNSRLHLYGQIALSLVVVSMLPLSLALGRDLPDSVLMALGAVMGWWFPAAIGSAAGRIGSGG